MPLGSLGTIYEGVSFFIGGGNVVAIDFMLNNVFNNFAYSCDQRTKQGWRNAGFTQGVSIPWVGIKYEPIYKECKKKLRSPETEFFIIEVTLSGIVAPPVVSTWTNPLPVDG